MLDRLSTLSKARILTRIGIIVRHRAVGWAANAMVVWDVDDARARALGTQVGGLDFVSHCYLRPRAESWPYNLFAMVHGHSREEVETLRARIATLLGDACRASDILYSTRILEKTGLRPSEWGQ